MTIAAAPPRPAPFEGSGEGRLSACLQEVRASLRGAAGADPTQLSDDELREAVTQWAAGLAAYDELGARIVAAAVERDLPRSDGAASSASWLTRLTRWPRRRAAEALMLARAHARLRTSGEPGPALAAWAAGDLSSDHATVVGRAVETLANDAELTLDADGLKRAQVYLVTHARSLGFDEFRVLANRVVEVVDPERADRALGRRLAAQEQRAAQQTVFRGRKGLDGVATFGGRMPNLHFDMLTTALEAIASPRRDHLRGAAEPTNASASPDVSTPHIPEAEVDGRPVPYGTRLGRALCELIERLPTDGSAPLGEGVNATVVVTIDERRLRSEVGAASLSTSDEISAGEARRLACGASVLPMVLSGRSAALDLGMARRLFTTYQRLALAQRDGGCAFAGCDRPPAWCEAHHLLPWSHGGPTDISNGVLLCGFHHRLVHAGEWQIVMGADGFPEVIPPARVDPRRRPIRHSRLKPRAG